MTKNREHIELGYIDIPVLYSTFTDKNKIKLCDNIIDTLLLYIDNQLDPTINRITFLEEVLDSTLQSNIDLELYEVAQVIHDCKKRLNDA